MQKDARTRQSQHRLSNNVIRQFGTILREYRETKGLRSCEFAVMLGLSQASLSRIENGLREPNLELLRLIHPILPMDSYLETFLKTGSFSGSEIS